MKPRIVSCNSDYSANNISAAAAVVISFGLSFGGGLTLRKHHRALFESFIWIFKAVEKTKTGTLHSAMKENGRDAIYFDYFSSEADLPPDVSSLYDVALVSGGNVARQSP